MTPLQQFAVAIGDTHLPTLADQPVYRIAQYLRSLGATTLLEYGHITVKLAVGTRIETLLFRDDGQIVYVPGGEQCKK